MQLAVIQEEAAGTCASVLPSSLMQMTMHAHADLAGYCQGAGKIFWQPVGATELAKHRVCSLQNAHTACKLLLQCEALSSMRTVMHAEA